MVSENGFTTEELGEMVKAFATSSAFSTVMIRCLKPFCLVFPKKFPD